MSEYDLAWSRAFLLTLLVEVPVVAFLLRRAEPSLRRRLTIAVLGNVASHPLVWFVFPGLGLPPYVALALSEVWAVGIEVLFLRTLVEPLGWRRAAWISLGANTLSFATGVVVAVRGG